MKFESQLFCRRVLSALVVLAAIPTFAQTGKLKLRVTPKQAYVFIDDRAISEASKNSSLNLTEGEHKVELVNYGYQPATQTVTITSGKTTELKLALEPVTNKVSGPFGAITIEGADRDAVLLNGKTPDFFVGHGDEFNNDWVWKQELVLPPGTYQLTLRKGSDAWSVPVTVAVDQRVVVDANKGVRKTVPWKRGEKLGTVPRFTVGTASATVAVAKPTAELSASAAQLNCGDTSQLKWTSSDAPQVEITPVGSVTASGDEAVQPKQTTTYDLTATGPGGTATSSVTVNVNTAIQANLGLSPAEVHYKRVGNEVVENGSTALTWSATNASNVTMDSQAVDASGSRSLTATPQKNDFGPVDETVTYTLTATNQCGGTDTQTVALHIVGSIEPGALAMRSVYFPTDLPGTRKASAGLLASEKEALVTVAEQFKQYLTFKSDARLVLSGYADKRGPASYNKLLSQRRAELVKSFLIEQGVPEANIDTQFFGKENNLTTDDVKQLLAKDNDLSDQERQKVVKRLGNIVLAYNRRVDVTLSSTGQQSARTYPFNANDFARLADRNVPKKPAAKVELAAQKERIGN